MSFHNSSADRETKPGLPLKGVVPSHYLSFRKLGKRIAGTYLLQESVQDEERIFLRLVKVMADGTWLSSHSRQHSMELGFTNQQGVWQWTGPSEITAKAIDVNYNPVGGDPTAISRVGFTMCLSEDLQEVRGEMYREIYHLDQNPLNPKEIPFATFGNTFTGRQVIVDEYERK